MKNAEIRVFGRAAQIVGGRGSAGLFLCAAAVAAAGGFMTAGVRLLLHSQTITAALSSVSSVLVPLVNAAVCVLLCMFILALAAPIRQGMRDFFLLGALSKRRSAARSVLTCRGRQAFKAFRLELTLIVLNLLSWVFFLLPGAALAAGGIWVLLSSGTGLITAAAILTGSVLLLIAGVVFCGVTRQLWAAAGYLVAAYPELSVRRALKLSQRLMRGHCAEFLRFKSGFALWFLSCLLLLPALFVFPYYEQSCAVWLAQTVKLGKNTSAQ